LVYNYDELKKTADETAIDDDMQARKDPQDLLKVVAEESDDRLIRFFKARQKYLSERTITFKHVWTLFRPGDIILGRSFQDQPQLFVVTQRWNTWPKKDVRGRWEPWRLLAWMYDWDGQHFSRRHYALSVEGFDGPKQITAL
jgi:hypothetical protein